MHCFIVFPFFLKYLPNAEYMISVLSTLVFFCRPVITNRLNIAIIIQNTLQVPDMFVQHFVIVWDV